MKFLKTVVWSIIKVSKKTQGWQSCSVWGWIPYFILYLICSFRHGHDFHRKYSAMPQSLHTTSLHVPFTVSRRPLVNMGNEDSMGYHSKTTCHLGCRIIQGLHKLQCFTFGKAGLYNVAMYWGGSLSTLLSIISFVLEKSCIIEFVVFWTDFLFTTIQIKTLISTPTFSQHFQSQPNICFLLPHYKFKSTMPTY